MGIIQRQSLKNSIVNYLGVGIGIISALFIYPLATEQYGMFRVLFDASLIFAPIILLGSQTVIVRFFPEFKTEDKTHHGLLLLCLLISVAGTIFFVALFPSMRKVLIEPLFENRSPLFQQFIGLIIPLSILLAFNRLLVQYVSNFQRITVPAVFDQLMIKLTLPVLILLFINTRLTNEQLMLGVIINYAVVFLAMIGYVVYLGQFSLKSDWSFLNPSRRKQIGTYSVFGILAFLGSQLAFRIDTVMVGGLISEASAGIYTIVALLSEIIAKPARAVTSVSGPIIADRIKTGDWKEVKMIYQKSSINLLIIGGLLFLMIWLSVSDILSLMSNTEEMLIGMEVILILGLARLFDMATGVNNEIINYSNQFRFNFYFILLLGILNVIFNLVFIPKYGITGAALATLTSIALFNLTKLIFIILKFKIQPFSLNTLWLLVIGVIVFFLVGLIPFGFHPLINLVLRSAIISGVFILPVMYLKLSPDLNEMIYKILSRVGWPNRNGNKQ